MPELASIVRASSRRLLLLEDEELVESMVRFALDGTGIELVRCRSVAEAEQRLGEQRFDLLLADLHLPGESGLSLLRRLRSVPGWTEGLEVISFSSGLHPGVRRELEALGVRRQLTKPASVVTLRACLVEAAKASPQPPTAAGDGSIVVEEGDGERLERYRGECLRRFGSEAGTVASALRTGDLERAAVLVREWTAMLRLLGEPEAARQAAELEVAALGGDAFAANHCWPLLHRQLLAIEPTL